MNIRTLLEGMMIRARLANLAGKTFGGKRDLFKALGYQRQLAPADYRSRFRRNEVAWRVVCAIPVATWRGGADVVEDEDPDFITDFEQAVIDLDERLGIWTKLQQVDILGRIGRYGVLFIGAPGELDTPLEKCAPEDIHFIKALPEEDALVQRYEIDKQSPRYGLPVMYTLNRATISSAGAINSATTATPVHYTRILHFATDPLDDEVFGTPVLEKIWNRLDDLEKVAGGGSEAFWRRADGGTQYDVDPTIDVKPDELDALKKEVELFENEMKRTLLTRGTTVNRLGSDVADIGPTCNAIIALISAGTGIPQRVLMGSEQGKLAAKQDRASFDNQIGDRQTDVAAPRFVRVLIDYFIKLGVLPEPVDGPTRYGVKFSTVKAMDDEQRATIAAQWASLNKPNAPVVVLPDEIRGVLGLAPMAEVASNEELRAIMEGYSQGGSEPVAAAKGGADRWSYIHAAADRFRAGSKADRLRRIRESKGLDRSSLA